MADLLNYFEYVSSEQRKLEAHKRTGYRQVQEPTEIEKLQKDV